MMETVFSNFMLATKATALSPESIEQSEAIPSSPVRHRFLHLHHGAAALSDRTKSPPC